MPLPQGIQNTPFIAPSIGCNERLLAGFSGKHYYCSVNPLCYAEDDYQLPEKSDVKKSVLVIGGGPGGMSAAITAAKRGFDVELWERSSRLGGNLWAAGLPTFKHDVLRLIAYMERQVSKLGVKVVLNKEATEEAVLAGKYDKVVLAAGSSPVMPPIEGIETAAPSNEYLLGLKKPGKKVVVIGGGLVGCETAAYMKETAEEVTIVEILGDILAISDHCLNNDQALRTMIKERNIGVVGDAKVTKITPNSITYTKDGQEHMLECDTVIIAAGYRSNDALECALENKVEDLTVIGDAEAPRKILTAVHEGYHTIRVM
jgi:2-enoate reductase